MHAIHERADKTVNRGRHESQCSICTHLKRDEIDHEFVSWTSPTKIASDFELSRDSIYRHAHATGLLTKRRKNLRRALEKIIERAGEVEVNASAVVSAVSAYARINAMGQWVERGETLDLNQLFERLSRDELDAYARDGTLPDWFPSKPRQEVTEDVS